MIPDIDRILHEPARLTMLIYLYSLKSADFTFLKQQMGMTQGNLSSHLAKLESAGIVTITKSFRGKRPFTLVELSEKGRVTFRQYVEVMHDFYSELHTMMAMER